MSKYYNPHRSEDWNFGGKNWRLSRGKIDLFVECPRCFYLDNKLGTGRPKGYPFNLNSAVDKLLKKEFDIHRAAGSKHPLMEKYSVDAVPFAHEKIDEWRDAMKRGITYKIDGSDVTVSGGVDDVWEKPNGELIIVDYKATSKDEEVNLDADWQDGYKRQMEIYQWLFRQNDYKVSNTGYFVYCNGDTDKAAFDGKLEFDIKLLPYEGDDSWVEATIKKAIKTLQGATIPNSGEDCDYCTYREAVAAVSE